MNTTHLEKLFAQGFREGKQRGTEVTTYEEGDENRYAKLACATLQEVMGLCNVQTTHTEAVKWRCGFKIGFLTAIVDRGL